ncbi:MAG TPA: PHP domain-containing protein [Phycisphaerales bacterium]|nr:PHP domain-containing protein [Phycisphaerales bacterium]
MDGGYQLIVLVQNETGYKNLCKLVTIGIFEGMSYKPRVDLTMLAAHNDGLLFLTGGYTGLFGPIATDADAACPSG